MSKSRVPAKLQAADRRSALLADLASEASVFEASFRLIKNMYQGSRVDAIKRAFKFNHSASAKLPPTPQYLAWKSAMILFAQVRLNRTSTLINKYDWNPRVRWSYGNQCRFTAQRSQQLMTLTEESAVKFVKLPIIKILVGVNKILNEVYIIVGGLEDT